MVVHDLISVLRVTNAGLFGKPPRGQVSQPRVEPVSSGTGLGGGVKVHPSRAGGLREDVSCMSASSFAVWLAHTGDQVTVTWPFRTEAAPLWLGERWWLMGEGDLKSNPRVLPESRLTLLSACSNFDPFSPNGTESS